jgi:hypothetical protein
MTPSQIDIRRIVESTLVPHTRFEDAKRGIKQCLAYSIGSSEPICLAILGESRTGKSRVLEEVHAEYPSSRDKDGAIVPILRVRVPAKPSVKGLVELLLEGAGDPKWWTGTENVKTLRLVRLLRDARNQGLMLDDFQHFVDTNSERVYHDVTNWLKNFVESAKVALIVAGLESCSAVLLQNEQMSGRFLAPISLRRFNWDDERLRSQFIGILQSFTTSLTQHFDVVELHGDEMAFRVWCATGGLMGYLAKLLRQAVWDALDAGRATITLEDLGAAYERAIWTETEVSLVQRPFSRDFAFTPTPEVIERIKRVGVRVTPVELPRSARNARRKPLSQSLAASGP